MQHQHRILDTTGTSAQAYPATSKASSLPSAAPAQTSASVRSVRTASSDSQSLPSVSEPIAEPHQSRRRSRPRPRRTPTRTLPPRTRDSSSARQTTHRSAPAPPCSASRPSPPPPHAASPPPPHPSPALVSQRSPPRYVVRIPAVSSRSFPPHGIPCSGPAVLPCRNLRIRRPRLLHRKLRRRRNHAPQHRVIPLDPFQINPRQPLRRNLPPFNPPRQLPHRRKRNRRIRSRQIPGLPGEVFSGAELSRITPSRCFLLPPFCTSLALV